MNCTYVLSLYKYCRYVRINQNVMNAQLILYNIVGAPLLSCLRPSPHYEYGKDGWPLHPSIDSIVHLQYRPVMLKCSCILQYNSVHSRLLY
jgi:hypothetical protein